MVYRPFLGIYSSSCSSEVLFVKFPLFVAFFVGLFFWMYTFSFGTVCCPRKYRLAVDLITCM